MQFENEFEYFKRLQSKNGAFKLGFGSTYSQSYRYGILTKELDLKNKTCVLLGCGEGAGVPFLQAKSCEKIYGFDIIESHVNNAKLKYPDLENNFFCISEIDEIFNYVENIDWIIASGTWNVKVINKKYSKVEDLLNLSNRVNIGIATNFTINVPQNDDVYNFCPFVILKMFTEKFNYWKVDHSYFENDFSIWGFHKK